MLKPPILLIHGMWCTPAVFDRLRPVLEAVGHATHAPMLPYHDRLGSLPPPSELGRLSITAYVDFLVAEVGKLDEPPVILGHSMGGLLAQLVAMRVPHAGLVLLSPAPAANSQVPSLDPLRTMKKLLLKWGWWKKPTLRNEEGARWGVFNGVSESVFQTEMAAQVWDSGRVMAESAFPGLFGNVTRVDYACLSQPALVVVGSDDRITPPGVARLTAQQLTGPVEFHDWPGVSHWPFWGDVEQRLHATVMAWLARFPGGRASDIVPQDVLETTGVVR